MTIACIYDLAFSIPLAAAVSSLYMMQMYPDVPAVLYLVTVCASSVYALLIRHLRSRGRLVIAGGTVTLILTALFGTSRKYMYDLFKDHKWAVYVAAFAIACTIMIMISNRYRIIRQIAAAILLIFLPLSLIMRFPLSKPAVISICALTVTVIADEIQHSCIKDGETDAKKHLVFIYPFILAVFIIASIVKTPDRPYDWDFVRKSVSFVKSTAIKVADMISGFGWEGDSPIIGFSDRSNLGGSVSGGGYTALDLVCSGKNDEYLYLSGKVFDTFDGRNWTASANPSGTDNGYDVLETMSAVKDSVGDAPVKDLARSVIMTERYTGLGNGRIFTPAKSMPDIKAEGKSYRLIFYRLNHLSPLYETLVNTPHTVTSDSLFDALSECDISDTEKYDLNGYRSYQRSVYNRYLPKTELSDKAQICISENIDGASTDWEKLCAIEEMLRGMIYTDRPGPLPEYISDPAGYIDYFLLEKKEGYCSYYATAFVVIARSCGIPSRYVQGYRAKAGDSLHIEVNSSSAHAWPEAYIDGVGWIAFEPTPGYGERIPLSGWATSEETEEHDFYGVPGSNPYDGEEGLGSGTDKSSALSSIDYKRYAVPVCAGVVFTLLLLGVDMIIRKRRYERLSLKEKALWHCRKNMHRLRRKKLGKLPEETLSEYKERLSGQSQDLQLDFLDIYARLLYSTADITDDEFKSLLFRI